MEQKYPYKPSDHKIIRYLTSNKGINRSRLPDLLGISHVYFNKIAMNPELFTIRQVYIIAGLLNIRADKVMSIISGERGHIDSKTNWYEDKQQSNAT